MSDVILRRTVFVDPNQGFRPIGWARVTLAGGFTAYEPYTPCMGHPEGTSIDPLDDIARVDALEAVDGKCYSFANGLHGGAMFARSAATA